jgi:hypothetical protein
MAKIMAFANVAAKLPNVVAGFGVFTTPMAFKEIHVKQILITHAQKVATIKEKLNDLKNGKVKLSFSIKLQFKKVELCKENLLNMFSRVGGIKKNIIVSRKCIDRYARQSKLKSQAYCRV